jgi:hypothetical protein
MWSRTCATCTGRVVSRTGPVEDGAQCTRCIARWWREKQREETAAQLPVRRAHVSKVPRGYRGSIPAPDGLVIALTSCLPPESERRKLARAGYSPDVLVKDMPSVFTFALVDVVSEDVKLSRGKARKAILRGRVTVNGAVARDPDMRVDGQARIVYMP